MSAYDALAASYDDLTVDVAVREAGGLHREALPPQPHSRSHRAGPGLRHRRHDVAADRPGL